MLLNPTTISLDDIKKTMPEYIWLDLEDEVLRYELGYDEDGPFIMDNEGCNCHHLGDLNYFYPTFISCCQSVVYKYFNKKNFK